MAMMSRHCTSLAGALLAACFALSATAAAETGKAPAALPPKTKMALKLAGLVTFVASSCPDLKPDFTRFKSVVGALGVSVGDLEKMEMKGAYMSYVLRYKEKTADNCARALKDFGPGGTVVPDMVQPSAR